MCWTTTHAFGTRIRYCSATMTGTLNKSYIPVRGSDGVTEILFSFYNDFNRNDERIKYVEAALILLLLVLSLVLTLATIILFLSHSDLRRRHQWAAITSMTCSFLYYPSVCLIAITRLAPTGWDFGDVGCKLTMIFTTTTLISKMWMMALIAVDRCLKVVYFPRCQISDRQHVCSIICMLVVSLGLGAFSTVPYSCAKYTTLGNLPVGICVLDFNGELFRMWIPLLLYGCLGQILPITITAKCYAKIRRKIQEATLARRRHTQGTTRSNVSQLASRIRHDKDNRMARIMITMMIVFIIMWLPIFLIMGFIFVDWVSQSYWLTSRPIMAAVCVQVLNTTLEPIFFILTFEKAHQLVRKTIRSKKCTQSVAAL